MRRLGHLLGPQRREVVDHFDISDVRLEHACRVRDVHTVRQRPVQEDGLHLRFWIASRGKSPPMKKKKLW